MIELHILFGFQVTLLTFGVVLFCHLNAAVKEMRRENSETQTLGLNSIKEARHSSERVISEVKQAVEPVIAEHNELMKRSETLRRKYETLEADVGNLKVLVKPSLRGSNLRRGV